MFILSVTGILTFNIRQIKMPTISTNQVILGVVVVGAGLIILNTVNQDVQTAAPWVGGGALLLGILFLL